MTPLQFTKHEVRVADDWSEWVCPDPKSYMMKCCDCGLVHEAQFGVVQYAVGSNEDCEPVVAQNVQAVFRMRRSHPWTTEDMAHRPGGLTLETPLPAADHIADYGKMVGGYSFAGKMIFERAKLIAALNGMYPSPAECHAARDMLAADAHEIEATERQVEILSDELSKCSKAQQVAAQPYDQQAMELCDVCGWKAIMPGEPCLVCNMQAQQVAKPDHKPDWSAA